MPLLFVKVSKLKSEYRGICMFSANYYTAIILLWNSISCVGIVFHEVPARSDTLQKVLARKYPDAKVPTYALSFP